MDSLGRRTHVISPGMGAFVTGYTNNGRIASETEPLGGFRELFLQLGHRAVGQRDVFRNGRRTR